MRTSQLAFVAIIVGSFVLAGSAAACSTSPAVTVIHGPPSESIKGDPLKFQRYDQEISNNARGGYFVIRSRDDWKGLWPSDPPPFPPTVELDRQMLILGVTDVKDIIQLRIERAMETADAVHVWVKETKLGEGCIARLERLPSDAVIAPRLDRPVKFYVEERRAEACGPPPTAAVKCRVGESQTWSEKLSAAPGDKIDCELTAESRGRFAVIDRELSLVDLPGGSLAKLAYSPKGAARGAFTIDVFGSYTVRAEAADESHRKGVGNASIEALPPRTKDVVVQLVWTNFDVSDDPDTFPRTKLVASEEPRAGSKARECSAESPLASLCAVKTYSAYTQMTLKAGAKKLPLSVTYLDERIEKGPVVCVQLYFDGQRTGETCDRVMREPQAKWPVGIVDLAKGTLVDPNEQVDGGIDAPDDGRR